MIQSSSLLFINSMGQCWKYGWDPHSCWSQYLMWELWMSSWRKHMTVSQLPAWHCNLPLGKGVFFSPHFPRSAYILLFTGTHPQGHRQSVIIFLEDMHLEGFKGISSCSLEIFAVSSRKSRPLYFAPKYSVLWFWNIGLLKKLGTSTTVPVSSCLWHMYINYWVLCR